MAENKIKKDQKTKTMSESLEIAEGLEVKYENSILMIKGKLGEVSRKIMDPRIKLTVDAGKIDFVAEKATKREKKKIKTFIAHIKNIFRGVSEGHNYQLKICASHFPMNVALSGDKLTVKNFLGEKVPRVLKIRESVKVAVDGQIITVDSINKELAGQTAADIESLCRLCGFDRRIFQDGIYITNKDGKDIK